MLECYKFYDSTNFETFFVLAKNKEEANNIMKYFRINKNCKLCCKIPYENALLYPSVIYKKSLEMD